MSREQFSNKKYLKVLATHKDSGLGLYDVLIYSYMLWKKDKYKSSVTNTATVAGTGISINTVAASLERLAAAGLYDNSVLVPDSPWDFFRQRNVAGSTLWDKAVGWITYIRNSDRPEPLTVFETCIYSYLYGCASSNFRPKSGWSDQYIATVLGVSSVTVKHSLERLQELRFLKKTGRDIGLYGKLCEDRLSYFADLDAPLTKRDSGTVGFIDEDEDEQLFDTPINTVGADTQLLDTLDDTNESCVYYVVEMLKHKNYKEVQYGPWQEEFSKRNNPKDRASRRKNEWDDLVCRIALHIDEKRNNPPQSRGESVAGHS